MPRKNANRPKPTIGAHIYEPVVIAELRSRGLACVEVDSLLIPATHADPETLAAAPVIQRRCQRFTERGLYPVFEPHRRELIFYATRRRRVPTGRT